MSAKFIGPCGLCGENTEVTVVTSRGVAWLCAPCGQRIRNGHDQPPAGNNQRAMDRRRWTEREALLAPLCAGTGARFIGIQTGGAEHGLEDLILLIDSYDSPFSLPASRFSTEAVRQVLAQRLPTVV